MAAVDAVKGTLEPEERLFSELSKGLTPFLDGDVLIAKITPCFENGKIAQARLQHRLGIGSTEFHVVRAHPDRADPRYLLHFLRQESVRRDGEQRMTGSAGQRRVPQEFISEIEIPLPPLAEQRRIVDILDRADALRAKRREATNELDQLTRSIFVEMFGDPATNPKRWPLVPIGKIGRVVTGNTPSRAVPDYFGNEIEWIKSDNINTPDDFVTPATEGLSASGRAVARVAPPSSILVTCIAGSPDCIGNSAMTDRPVAFNQQINALIPEQGDADFIYSQFVVGKRLIQRASTSSMKGMVSKSRFERVEIMFPPVDLQRDFARRISAARKLKGDLSDSLAHMDALFASLQQRAFRGEP
jgi:type I restriction enzyme S subunit